MKNKKIVLAFLIMVVMSFTTYLYFSDNKKENYNINALAYNDSDFLVLIDANYGNLVGFTEDAGYYFIKEGLYGYGYKAKNVWAGLPHKVRESKRGNESLVYFSKDHNCSTRDLELNHDIKVSSHTVFYSCYEGGNSTTITNNYSKDHNDYMVIFDSNYGELKGFNSNGFYDLGDGVYGTNDVNREMPELTFESKQGKNYLLYWSQNPDCSTRDLARNGKINVSNHTVYYACYIQTHFDKNGIRETHENAYVSGDVVKCGDNVRVKSCYMYWNGVSRNLGWTEYCEFDQINGKSKSGVVLRNKLGYEGSGACENKETYTAIFYEDKDGVDGGGIECGKADYYAPSVCSGTAESGGTIFTPDTSKLNFNGNKFIGWAADDDGKNVNCSGELITSSSIAITGNNKYYPCYESDVVSTSDNSSCVNSNDIIDAKGSYEVKVCYSAKISGKYLKLTPKTKEGYEIINCAEGYKLDDVSETNIIETTCTDKEGDCYRKYNLSCISKERPKISATSTTADSQGFGTIKFSASSKVGIKGWYQSEYYKKPTKSDSWNNDSSGNYSLQMEAGTTFLWAVDANDQISYAAMASVIDKVHEDTTLKNMNVKDENGNSLNASSYSFNDSVEGGITSSSYVRLSNDLLSSSKVLASGFNPFDTAYKITTKSSKISVYATLTSNDANYVKGYEPRTVDLDYGVNTILIKIKSKSGRVRTYTIVATREDDRDATNYLKSLKVSKGKLQFDQYTSDYVVSVGKNVKSVSVNAELLSLNSKYEDGFGPRTIELNNESTTMAIKVVSETGSARAYTITFVKNGDETDEKDDVLLSSLSLSKAYVAFDSAITDYNTTVDYEVESINIYALAENGGDAVKLYRTIDGETSEVSATNVPLYVGANNITIIVSNSKGKSRTYTLNILRKEDGLLISSDTALSMLSVDGYDIDFKPDVYDYELKIKREKTLVIAATPMSNRAEVYIRGNDTLTAFSTVRIKVVSENGQFKEYTLDIKKDTVNKTIETIFLIGGVAVIICGIIIIGIKKKRKSVKDYYAE